ncbi:MAG: M61 family metallopeptidase, partial [Planctomycetota bacterium]
MPIRRATPVAAALAALAAASATHADGTIRYTVRLDAPQTQMVDIGVEVRVGAEAGFVDFSMPAWRPGRYLIHDPAGGVQEVRATDEGGNALPVEKLDKDTWRVMRGDATAVRLDYRLYANSLGSRTRHVDDTHAFLSGDSVFVYAEGRRDSPVLVEVEAPDAWRIAGGLEFAEGRTDAVVAPDYDVLIDTPLEIGIHDTLEFTVGGRRHEIVIWPVDHAAYDAEQLTGDFARIVEAQLAIFGRLPYERYVFLVHAGAGAGGGTEHLNSTIMQTSRAALEGGSAYRRFLGLVSHEFFHTWNVKQLRPAGINPYDYTRENYTKLLWVAEGTT